MPENLSSEEIANLYRTKQEELGKYQATAPRPAQTATDPEIQALRGQAGEKLKELFSYDQKLADVYFQPEAAPAVAGETVPKPSPMLIDPTIGLLASSKQTQATAAEVTDILKEIATRKEELQDTYERGLAIFNLGLQSRKDEMSALGDLFNMASSIEERNLRKSEKVAGEEKEKKSKERYSVYYKQFSAWPDKAEESLRTLLQQHPEDSEIIRQAYADAKGDKSGTKEEQEQKQITRKGQYRLWFEQHPDQVEEGYKEALRKYPTEANIITEAYNEYKEAHGLTKKQSKGSLIEDLGTSESSATLKPKDSLGIR